MLLNWCALYLYIFYFKVKDTFQTEQRIYEFSYSLFCTQRSQFRRNQETYKNINFICIMIRSNIYKTSPQKFISYASYISFLDISIIIHVSKKIQKYKRTVSGNNLQTLLSTYGVKTQATFPIALDFKIITRGMKRSSVGYAEKILEVIKKHPTSSLSGSSSETTSNPNITDIDSNQPAMPTFQREVSTTETNVTSFVPSTNLSSLGKTILVASERIAQGSFRAQASNHIITANSPHVLAHKQSIIFFTDYLNSGYEKRYQSKSIFN